MNSSTEEQNFLYKYKALATSFDIIRLCDIIEKHRIYLPKYSSLNDPFEGSEIRIKPKDGYAGCTMAEEHDSEYSVFDYSIKENYKILSLSEVPDSTQLWAHYSDNHKGCSLIFKKTGPFSQARKVKYINDLSEPLYVNSLSDEILQEEFLVKNCGWSYEKEWRIISNSESNYLYFDKSNLFGIIFGSKINEEIFDFLNGFIKIIYPDNTFKTYKAYPGKQSNSIRFTRGDKFKLIEGENIFVNIGD